MKASGAGGPGTVSADVRVSLAEVAGGTELSYDADAVVGGVIGGVGQRMLAGVAKKLAAEFFANVDAVLTGAPAEAGSAGEQPAVSADQRAVYRAPEAPAKRSSPAPASRFRSYWERCSAPRPHWPGCWSVSGWHRARGGVDA